MKTDVNVGSGCLFSYRHPLVRRVSSYLTCLSGMADPSAGRAVGWTPLAASLAAVLMSLDVGCTLAVRCEDALACLGLDLRRAASLGKTYNGLIKALLRQASAVLPIVKTDLRRQARAAMATMPRVHGWLLLAVDGSKEDLPRTASCERHFGVGDNGKQPQALVTAIVEVMTGLLWDWRIDPARGSEKDHLVQMVGDLPDQTLLLADGNFVGYPVWSALKACGRSFLIRVGGNVKLLRRLCPDARIDRRRDIVYAWPKQRRRSAAPLRLRLIRVGCGDDAVYLLTDVLDRRRLSDAAAGKAYRLRWGVELFYRTFKRTFGQTKLRSRSGVRARVELEWAMISLWVVTLMGVTCLQHRGICPRRLSPAVLLRAVRHALLHHDVRQGVRRALTQFDQSIATSVGDTYTRHASKRSRHRPITHNTPFPLRLKPPNIRNASTDEQHLASQSMAA